MKGRWTLTVCGLLAGASNHIAVIRVNPGRFPRVNGADAVTFVDWLGSMEAQQLVQRFGVDRYGEPLFFPNSQAWHRARRS